MTKLGGGLAVAARLGIAATLAFGWTAGASAQVPPDVAAKIRAAGPTMNPSAGQPYAPVYADKSWNDVTAERDLAYGPGPLQKLDVFTRAGARRTRRPIVLFVHGGGFERGDKHGAYYPDNIAQWAAENGMVGVSINYRLAPAAPWPAAAQDIAAAIGWVRVNASRFGGDPDRIVLFGHSAGANHVADYIGHAEIRGAEAKAVKGAVLLSPHYAPASQAGPPFYAAPREPGAPHPYYGHEISLQSAEGSIARLKESRIPLLLADAEFDPPEMLAYSQLLLVGLCRAPVGCPRYVHLPNHNHFTEGMSFGTADRLLSNPLLEWIGKL
jgi:acetyl esterase/lipase